MLHALICHVIKDKLEESLIVQEMEAWTDTFTRVTNNLESNYKYASETVAESFEDKDIPKLTNTIKDLVEAVGKDVKGSFQKMFDHRDQKLKCVSSQDIDDDWVEI